MLGSRRLLLALALGTALAMGCASARVASPDQSNGERAGDAPGSFAPQPPEPQKPLNIDNLPPATPPSVPLASKEALPGATPYGHTCQSDAECEPVLVCNEGLVPPACVPPMPLDEACAQQIDCGEQLACNTSLKPSVCRPRNEGGEGALCSQDLNCRAGLRCLLSETTGRCLPR